MLQNVFTNTSSLHEVLTRCTVWYNKYSAFARFEFNCDVPEKCISDRLKRTNSLKIIDTMVRLMCE